MGFSRCTQVGTRRSVALALPLFLLVAACGDDNGDVEAGDAAGTGDTVSQAAGDFCGDLETYVTHAFEFMEALFETSTGDGDADALREAAEPLADDSTQVALSAPEHLFDDVELVNAEILRVVGTVEASDYDVTDLELPVEPDEVGAARDRVNDYARNECGFDPDQIGDGTGQSGSA